MSGGTPQPVIPGLFEAVPDALVVIDAEGRIVHANGHAEVLFGYARGGLAGVGIEDLVPAAARGRHREQRTRYMARPHVRPMGATGQTLVGLRSDGSEFAVEIALSPLESADGPLYLASVRDISGTQRVRLALARARYDAIAARIAQLALEASSETELLETLPPLLAEALGVGSVAILAAPHGGHEAALRATTGPAWTASTRPRPFAGQHREPWIIDDIASDPSAAALFPLPLPNAGSAVMVPVLERHRVAGALLATDPALQRFDHDMRHLLQSAAAALAAFMQQRRTEEQLAHAHRLDAIGQLTGGVAHDFNNLLTVMSGSLQLLEGEVRSGSGRELLGSALRSVGRGAELTAKLLAFARRQRLQPREVDVAALLRDLEVVLRRALGDGRRLESRVADDLPTAYVDAGQLEAALLNLVLNARDALDHGGRVELSAHAADIADDHPELAPGRYLVLTVRDDGSGMSPETLARAMEPFFTTKGGGRGSGLGLSMVYGFARQSGGGLDIESTPGEGTEARLRLPVATGVPVAAAPARPAAAGPAAEGARVLVVEDDDAVRAIAVAFLRAAGHQVDAVPDAEAALARLRGDAGFALLFTDVMLGPGMDGKTLARHARALRPGLAVLLTSGDEEHAAGAEGAQALRLLRKPWRREELVDAVRRELDAAD